MYNRQSNTNKDNHNNQKNLPKINFDYEKNPQLFGKVAEEWAKQLESESRKEVNKSSQIRQFYDKLLSLYEKSQNIEDNEYSKKVYPFVVMLKSKVAYAKTRKKVSNTFEQMINSCIDQSVSKKNLETFKLFFEAVIGFYPKK